MDFINYVGLIACAITVLYTSIGLPSQILKNRKEKSAKSLSPFLFYLLASTFFSWTIYGYLKPDLYIMIPNGLGFVFSAVLIYQIHYYR